MQYTKRRAARILERELQSLRKMLALEINKANFLEQGDIDQTMVAQEACGRMLESMKTLPETLADEFPDESMRPTKADILADEDTRVLYEELETLVQKILTLSGRNQERVKHLMGEVSSSLRKLHRNRFALQGYRPKSENNSVALDGKL